MSQRLKHLLVSSIVIFSFFVSLAEIKLPAIIADNMVLQQNSNIKLWGWANAGEKVTVTASWSKSPVSVVTDNDGKWILSIKTIKAGGPYTIKFAASNTIEVSNVVLGEVWLASGQSNMEFFMKKMSGGYTGVLNYEEEIKAADYPLIRTIDVPNKVSDDPQTDFVGK